MGGRFFEVGGRGCLEGQSHVGGKAGDTFSLEKTGFSLSTKTLSSLEPIRSLYLSLLSTTLYTPPYSWERGREEASSQKNTNLEFSKVLGKGLFVTGQVS